MENGLNTSNEGTFYAVIKAGMSMPLVQINRKDFLQTELSKYFEQEKVNLAINNSPARAGISKEEIEKIADNCISYETNKVSLISAATGAPGGYGMAFTVPADIAQYFGHVLRILQKLIYLYGWEDLNLRSNEFDDETLNQLTLFIGIMFGVNAANAAIIKIAPIVAKGVEKQIIKVALTKTTFYPIVKRIAALLGVKMTKELFARSVGKLIPFVSVGIMGALTYITFRPLAIRLKKYLKELPTADVNFYKKDNNDIIIDVDFSDIDIS